MSDTTTPAIAKPPTTKGPAMSNHQVYVHNAFQGDYGIHHPASYALFLAGNERGEIPDLVTPSHEAVKRATITHNQGIGEGVRPRTQYHLDASNEIWPFIDNNGELIKGRSSDAPSDGT
jgi:hypothetical protein